MFDDDVNFASATVADVKERWAVVEPGRLAAQLDRDERAAEVEISPDAALVGPDEICEQAVSVT